MSHIQPIHHVWDANVPDLVPAQLGTIRIYNNGAPAQDRRPVICVKKHGVLSWEYLNTMSSANWIKYRSNIAHKMAVLASLSRPTNDDNDDNDNENENENVNESKNDNDDNGMDNENDDNGMDNDNENDGMDDENDNDDDNDDENDNENDGDCDGDCDEAGDHTETAMEMLLFEAREQRELVSSLLAYMTAEQRQQWATTNSSLTSNLCVECGTFEGTIKKCIHHDCPGMCETCFDTKNTPGYDNCSCCNRAQLLMCPVCQEEHRPENMMESESCCHAVCWKCFGQSIQSSRPISACPLCRAVFCHNLHASYYQIAQNELTDWSAEDGDQESEYEEDAYLEALNDAVGGDYVDAEDHYS